MDLVLSERQLLHACRTWVVWTPHVKIVCEIALFFCVFQTDFLFAVITRELANICCSEEDLQDCWLLIHDCGLLLWLTLNSEQTLLKNTFCKSRTENQRRLNLSNCEQYQWWWMMAKASAVRLNSTTPKEHPVKQHWHKMGKRTMSQAQHVTIWPFSLKSYWELGEPFDRLHSVIVSAVTSSPTST